jgi:hypothetical protein
VLVQTADTTQTYVVRGSTRTKLRPNLVVRAVTAPRIVFATRAFDVAAEIVETNGDIGASATVTLSDGDGVIGSAPVTVQPGGTATATFTAVALSDAGRHDLSLEIRAASPAETDTGDNRRRQAVDAITAADHLDEVLAPSLGGYGAQMNQNVYAAITGAPPGVLSDLESKVIAQQPGIVRVFYNDVQVREFWDYWDTAKLEQRLNDVRAIVDALPPATRKPLYSMEYGVRGIKSIGGTTFVDPGVWDADRRIPITQTNVNAFQQAWFDVESAALGYAGTVKWDSYYGKYDKGSQAYFMIGHWDDAGNWPLNPIYHVVRLFTASSRPGWSVHPCGGRFAARHAVGSLVPGAERGGDRGPPRPRRRPTERCVADGRPLRDRRPPTVDGVPPARVERRRQRRRRPRRHRHHRCCRRRQLRGAAAGRVRADDRAGTLGKAVSRAGEHPPGKTYVRRSRPRWAARPARRPLRSPPEAPAARP